MTVTRTGALETSIDTLNELLSSRLEWELNELLWTYSASFNGVLVRDAQFPRGRDLGLSLLSVMVEQPGIVTIESCGVRGGCQLHAARTEVFELDRPDVLERGLAAQERRATEFDLRRLAWCLVGDACSRTTADSYLW